MVSDMRGKSTTVTVLIAVIAACSSSGSPATAPTDAPTTATTATTAPPATTTTTVATTTTIDRTAEIEAIFRDLEERRLRALYDGDREAFRSLFANDEYMNRSMALFDLVEFVNDWSIPDMAVVQLLADQPGCIAARLATDYAATLGEGGEGETIHVVELRGDEWAISYAGEGWQCDGPHPLLP